MDITEATGNTVHATSRYERPQLTRLGGFRELTGCGSLLDILFGRIPPGDSCYLQGSSHFSFYR